MNKVKTRNDSNGSKVAATVVLHHASDFSPAGKRKIVAWLRREATFLEKHNDRLSSTYTARWRYS